MVDLAGDEKTPKVRIMRGLPGHLMLGGYKFRQGMPELPFCEYPKEYDFRSDLLSQGYSKLKPILDLDLIAYRQQVIREFLTDIQGERQMMPILNMMHLAVVASNYHVSRPNEPDLKTGSTILKRYISECEKFTDVMKNKGGLLAAFAENFSPLPNKKEFETTLAACKKGAFDHLLIEMNPVKDERSEEISTNSVRIIGVMGDGKGIKEKRHVGSSVDSEFKFDDKLMVRNAYHKSLVKLDDAFSPFLALYSEAFLMFQRMQKGRPVCLPRINEDGIFEIQNGEPIIPTKNPAGTSISYDQTTARIILNGLHSGGKTHLLQNLPLYYLVALSGFPVPAASANIPTINNIYHSFTISKDKYQQGGGLETELKDRAVMLSLLKKGDIYVIDEFLQHASPDAAADLEPIILDEIYKTGATAIVVTHRGEQIVDGEKWNFYSPGYRREGKRIAPTFQFSRGRPDDETLRQHAKQMLEDILAAPKEEKVSNRDARNNCQDYRILRKWDEDVSRRVLSGDY